MGVDALSATRVYCDMEKLDSIEKSTQHIHPEITEDLADSTINNEAINKIIECNKLVNEDEKEAKIKEIGANTPILPSEIGTDFNFKREIVWFNAIGFLLLHIAALIGGLLALLGYAKFYTVVYTAWLVYASGQGVTMGAHRLWAHRAFKANIWLRIFLLFMHTLAGQNCLWVWVRDHRQHHKYSDTDADPHNANRGFFFSHVGWLLSRKHPKVIEYGKKIDMSDLEADPWIMFQKQHYKVLYTIFALLLPTVVPIICWNENPIVALFLAYFTRTVIQLNVTWLVNSAAHLFGTRPYDKTMLPVESMFLGMLAAGEGWHNYHHAFPWDYRASELGTPYNLTGYFIDRLAEIGWVWDRKTATPNMVKNRVLRTGDGSHLIYGNELDRRAVKTFQNWWKHPMNPSYTSIYFPQPKTLKSNGYALISDELDKSELDEERLKKENDDLQHKQNNDDALKNFNIAKYIVGKAQLNDGTNDVVNYVNNNIKHSPQIKSTLNISEEHVMERRDTHELRIRLRQPSSIFTHET
ncbi:acyl-CoA Delta-9 desaturase-like [Phlebotomus papatasi]|uniref:acyl-CoA Delta-9 desaturase-like n=1 Tax=Phlebotomus papatasi TaxID=29031 RepID=UPI002483688A|nr:acyl-CoA Delta-9 desaturase-like [Phlebotomus papatasi]XP_055697531.1 acyl-CoA Delta-9 desaturase-like [Phlebotomus papatasi]